MSDPVNALLARLEAVKGGHGQWTALCPAHEDDRSSLSVSRGQDGRALLNCHAGCEPSAVCAALGIEVRDLFPPNDDHVQVAHGAAPGQIIATYPYVDEHGELLYEVVRYAPKDFRPRRPDGRQSLQGVRRVLYRLPTVVAAIQAAAWVFVCEGEKDADSAARLGVTATCNPFGAATGKAAGKKWLREYSESLRGARVAILPDNDEAGREHAENVRQALAGFAREVKVIALPGLPPKGDVTDWVLAGGTATDLIRLAEEAGRPPRKFPRPLSVVEMLEMEDPEEQWIAEGIIPTRSNILLAAYPKSHKTNACLELAIAATSETPFMGRWIVPRAHSVGIVMMEGAKHMLKRRLVRLCQGRGIDPRTLDGRLHPWFRPPLRLSDPLVMAELADDARDLGLDLLIIDNWSYVATGNSNDSDEVTPQLDALSRIRDQAPELSVLLVHHARKSTSGDGKAVERLTDLIRGSGGFGAWYDVGLAFAREDEHAPVSVRVEMRDLPGVKPFAFEVTDEFPPGPETGQLYPSGWMRVLALEGPASSAVLRAKMEPLLPHVIIALAQNRGCTKRRLRELVAGGNTLVDAAFADLQAKGYAMFEEPQGRGKGGRCFLTAKGIGKVPGAERAIASQSGAAERTHGTNGHSPREQTQWDAVDTVPDRAQPCPDRARGTASVPIPPVSTRAEPPYGGSAVVDLTTT